MSLEAMISIMSRDEKIAAMELLWRDLAQDVDSLPSPEWHEPVIAQRLANPAGEQALPLSEARTEIEDAINARRASN